MINLYVRRIAPIVALVVLLQAAPIRGAEDEPPDAKADRATKARLDMMQKAIDDFHVRSSQIESPAALRFRGGPILRFNDPSRRVLNDSFMLLDATAWRLGEKGRPLAIVTLEMYARDDSTGRLAYEFVSLTPSAFEMKNSRDVVWTPSSTQMTMTPLADAPAPADTKRSRLVQLREIARRFTAQEDFRGEKLELRMLPQPIDRYDDVESNILDGAIFVFANGTNPEMGLLLECSDKQWSYGVFRLAWAALFAQFDGKSFEVPAKGPGLPVDAPYTAAGHAIVLPE
jgi:hypothetical protein